jgi:hypothetical protein
MPSGALDSSSPGAAAGAANPPGVTATCMNRFALPLAVTCALLWPSVAFAQDKNPLIQIKEWVEGIGKPKPPPEPKLGARNTLTLNPLALQHQRLGLEYERALGSVMSLYLAPQVAYGSAGGLWRLSTAGTLGARFFVLGSAPSGIFFGPEVGAVYERARLASGMRSGLGLGFGASVGWTLVFFDRFVLSVGFAAQFRSVPDIDAPEPDAIRVEFGPLPRFAFGVAF